MFKLLRLLFTASALLLNVASTASTQKKGSVFNVEILSNYSSSLNTNLTVQISSDTFSMLVGPEYGVKLLWDGADLVGDAVGLYASFNGSSTLNYTSVQIVKETSDMIDVSFISYYGSHHVVMQKGLQGFYSYFVNELLPPLGEFRTLFRLNPDVFQNGYTSLKEGPLPVFPADYTGIKVQDETWLTPDNRSYITKYDWAARTFEEPVYGVYGKTSDSKSRGFWLISPGNDYYVGDQTKQELMLHRESSTGDVVLLNMLHGTHFESTVTDNLPKGKIWGPYLWYFNDGSSDDAKARLSYEREKWPYSWLSDTDYQSRGLVEGQIKLSSGEPASFVNVFLGDEGYSMTQGVSYYYKTSTDAEGNFKIENIRARENYVLQAFPSYESADYKVGDIIDPFVKLNVTVKKSKSTKLGKLIWEVPNTKTVWQIGAYDRTTLGFAYGALSYQHALIDECPADLTYTVGFSQPGNWCFGKSYIGSWHVIFFLDSSDIPADSTARLYISVAAYTGPTNSSVGAGSTTLSVAANDYELGEDIYNSTLVNDMSTYRSSAYGGKWTLTALDIPAGVLVSGRNYIDFTTSEFNQWRGILWDSVKLVWLNP
ncbi:polysaccharide lyase family 4, domain III-domain-containing protein [Dipodascopsis uninucleata]